MYGMFQGATSFTGDLSKRDVSSVKDMYGMFMGATAFNGDLPKWDVSSVTNMAYMFRDATSFNRDLSKWDVSNVANMDYMFTSAESFTQKLCGAAWVSSAASKEFMFIDSLGSIARTVCMPAFTHASMLDIRQYVSRHPLPDRELIRRTPITTTVSTPAITSTSANRIPCSKCGTFKKSGRVSCCA